MISQSTQQKLAFTWGLLLASVTTVLVLDAFGIDPFGLDRLAGSERCASIHRSQVVAIARKAIGPNAKYIADMTGVESEGALKAADVVQVVDWGKEDPFRYAVVFRTEHGKHFMFNISTGCAAHLSSADGPIKPA